VNEKLGIIEERQARLHAIMATARISPAARSRIMGEPIYLTPPVPKPKAHPTEQFPRASRQAGGPVCVDDIMTAVSFAFRVHARPVLGKSKERWFSRPRFAAALLMKEKMAMSNIRIGEVFNRLSEASGGDMIRRAKFLLAYDQPWAALYRVAEHALDQK
jgi:hypothetical protein